MKQLCSSVNNDIRQVLNLLQMLRVTTDRLDSAPGAFQTSMADGRHVEQNVFSVLPQLFSGSSRPPNQALDLFFHDYDLMPLFVQENYLNTSVRLDAYANAADLISYGDLVKDQMMKTNDWGMLPFLGMVSTVIPSAMVRSRVGSVNFPQWLGKQSNANKQKRLLKEIQVHMSPKTSGTAKTEVRLDYIPALMGPMLTPLQQRGQEGIDEVLERMNAYNLSKDDWETLFVLTGQESTIQSLDPKLKAAFTRKYNKTQKRVAVAPVSSKKGSKVSRLADDESEYLNKEAEEYNGEENDEEDDEAIGKHDALIVQKKPKKTPAASKAKPKTTKSTKTTTTRKKK